jgi:transcriptional regulator with XRE-family HTH domain
MKKPNLKKSMDRHGLTVADVSLLTGSSARMVNYWKSGEWPTPRLLELILIALDEGKININWLIAKLK